jgi:hypothetical protein
MGKKPNADFVRWVKKQQPIQNIFIWGLPKIDTSLTFDFYY